MSFNHLDSWITEFRGQCPNASIVIAGNKCDMASLRAVSKSAVAKKAKGYGCFQIEVSAKNHINIEELFNHVAKELYSQSRGQPVDNDLIIS